MPLIAHVGAILKELPEIDRAVVSTDDTAIGYAAHQAGLQFAGLRPAALAGDHVPDWPVLEYELSQAEARDQVEYDFIVMLQPTCPLRTAKHVRAACDLLVSGGFDAVWTVSETDSKHHPLKQLRLDEGVLEYYDPRGSAITARQQLSQLYHRNGAAYVFTRQCLLEQRTIKGARTGVVVVAETLISIDTWEDFALCEWLMARGAGPFAAGQK